MGKKTIQSVLIVDDDAVSRKKLCRIFQRLGIEQVKEAEQGDEALTMLKEQPVDLVMADWHMPRLNGLDLLKAIRADENLRETSVFLVTVEGRQAQIVEAVQAKTTEYIMKPFSQESIKEKLGHLIPAEVQPVE
jgi:two-component system chemotaxis response regulator CheY